MHSKIYKTLDEMENKSNKKFFSYIGLSYIFSYFLSLILLGIVFSIISKLFLNKNYLDYFKDFNMNMLFSSFSIILSTVLLSLFFRKISRVKITERKLPVKKFLIFILISIGVGTFLNILTRIFISIITNYFNIETVNNLELLIGGANFYVILLTTGIIAPIIEEIFFRKLLCDRVVIYGEKTAIFVSALMFGLFHGNMYQLFYALGIGLVLAYMYCKTGKLRYSIITHMIINLLSVLLVPLLKYFPKDTTLTLNYTWQFYGLILLTIIEYVASFIGVVLLFKKIKDVKLLRGCITIPRNKYFKTVFINFGMIVFILIFLTISIVSIQ